MFEKKKEGDPETPRPADTQNADALPPLRPFTRKATPVPPRSPQVPAFKSELPRRLVDMPGASKRPLDVEKEPKRLTVGRDICLSGDITSCDRLVVEGTVEAKLTDARAIEVAETGVFKGDAVVDEADINGRFIGELTVRERLIIRSHGLITGSVRYGRMVVEEGGAISGSVALLDAAEEPSKAAEPVVPLA